MRSSSGSYWSSRGCTRIRSRVTGSGLDNPAAAKPTSRLVDSPSEFDPYSQKGMGLPIVAECRDDCVILYPKMNLLITAIALVGWTTLVVGGIIAFAPVPRWFIPLAVICGTIPCVIILCGCYFELSKGPYVVIDLQSRTILLPRTNKELSYLQIRRIVTGWRWERVADSWLPYNFLDAEILDTTHQPLVVTLVATMNRWELRRLERVLRIALQSDQ